MDSMDSNVWGFLKESGFKILALARLSQCEYSVVLYLLNCAVSKLDQFVTTESELASIMGYEEKTLRQTLSDLYSKNIIRLKYGENLPAEGENNSSLRIGLQYDTSKWIISHDQEVTSQDAVVFPFHRRGENANLQVFQGKKGRHVEEDDDESTWRRVIDSYLRGESLDDDELEQAEKAAKVLVQTHPVDQVLLMIRHFGRRIPTLSLLASSWQHYQEIFEAETQKVDMLDARQKHLEQDQKVRDRASEFLEDSAKLELNEEETTVLKILQKHRHPRRQLFWAYQMRSRYPNLETFFAENASLMLPVTSSGTVIKRPHHEE